MVAPVERFRLAATDRLEEVVVEETVAVVASPPASAAPVASRRVSANGKVSLAGFGYHAGRWLAGQTVDITSRDGLVEVSHNGVLIATHARRHPPEKEPAVLRRQPRARPATSGPTVIRKVDSHGAVSFAGSSYQVGNAYKRRQVEVSVVGDTVQITVDSRILRTHRAVHDRAKEHGAFATPATRSWACRTATSASWRRGEVVSQGRGTVS